MVNNEGNNWGHYKVAVISFYDILGFKEIVKQGTFDDAYLPSDYMNLHSDIGGKLEDRKYNLEKYFYSDSFIRIAYSDVIDFENILNQEIKQLCKTQFSLHETGTLIRGVLTIGDIYSESTTNRNHGPFVFGKGYLRAYDLEQNKVVYPRIIIDIDKLSENILKDKINCENEKLFYESINLKEEIEQESLQINKA